MRFTKSSRPLYLQLADHLRKQIEDGQFAAGEKLASEPELAEQFGLARGTIRQALEVLMDQGYLERVQGKGTFIRKRLTEQPAGPRRLVGVIVPFLRDALIIGMLRGMEQALRQQGYSLIYGSSDGDLNEEINQIRRLQDNGIAGLILMPISLSNEAMMLSQVLSPALPFVVIDRRVPGYEASIVQADNFGGAVLAVEHLLSLGHRRIACITHKGYISSVEERVRGYEHAMRAAGLIPLAAVPLVWHGPTNEGLPPDFTDEEMQSVAQLLQSPDRPTGLFCINDFIAHGVAQFVTQCGWQVPQDLALVGFDDIPVASFLPVPLTTIAQPTQDIGRDAALLLLEKVAGSSSTAGQAIAVGQSGQGGQAEKKVLPVSLVVRQSTGSAAISPEIPGVSL